MYKRLTDNNLELVLVLQIGTLTHYLAHRDYNSDLIIIQYFCPRCIYTKTLIWAIFQYSPKPAESDSATDQLSSRFSSVGDWPTLIKFKRLPLTFLCWHDDIEEPRKSHACFVVSAHTTLILPLSIGLGLGSSQRILSILQFTRRHRRFSSQALSFSLTTTTEILVSFFLIAQ